MDRDHSTILASVVVVLSGVLWGFYWLPVRGLDDLGVPGAWGTLSITAAAAAVLAPFTLRRWRVLAGADLWAVASIALGGAAFALYSIGFIFGHVAIIILLWFLTPVWSVLIARFVLGWPTPRLRVLAIGLGIAGLFIMLSAGGAVPLPSGLGEWLALLAGFLWAIATTGIRVRPEVSGTTAAFIFALGASLTAAVIAPILTPWPALESLGDPLRVTAISLGTGAIWWGLSIVALMWATVRLEPARVGLLLMSEVLVGALSAALIAGEVLSLAEMIGGALVLGAGVLEVWPVKRRA